LARAAHLFDRALGQLWEPLFEPAVKALLALIRADG
jgi:hypothetical protein